MSERRPSDPSASRHGKRHLRTPTEQLGRKDKLLREAMHRRVLVGLLVIVLIAVGFAALFSLDSWPQWVVLAAICATVIGVVIATSPARRS